MWCFIPVSCFYSGVLRLRERKLGLDIYSFLLLQKKPKTKTKPHVYMTETIVAVLGPRERCPSTKPKFWRIWGRYEVDERSVRKGWLVLISPRMILPRPLKKNVHRLPEKGHGKPQAQRIKGHMRVTDISSEAKERTLGTRKILSTQNSNYSLTSLESGKFIPNIGKSQSLNRGSTPFYLGIPHIHTKMKKTEKTEEEKYL